MSELLASGALVANLVGFLIAAGLFLLLVFLAYRISEHVSRGVVFATVFALLFVVAWSQELLSATGDVAVSVMMALTALGRATLAFIGGNGFALVPELPGAEPTLAWISANPIHFGVHAVFEFLSLLALALTAEGVLSVFTSASTWLSTHFDHFDQVVVVTSSSDMAPYARSFVVDAARGDNRPRAVFSIAKDASGERVFRLCTGNTTRVLPYESFRRRLTDAVRSRASARVDDAQLALVTLRNGRITVTSYGDEPLSPERRSDLVGFLMSGETENSPVDPEDVYSYSVEEIRVRQLVRRLLPPVDQPGAQGFGLGLKPLNAMVIGDDVERVVLMVAYLIRNGQALTDARADGSVRAVAPRIAIASPQASRISRRLRCAYPALFPDDSSTGQGPRLTPPAVISAFESKFEMLDAARIGHDDLVLVINTEPDLGRAPTQRQLWQQRLQKRLGGTQAIYVQYSGDEDSCLVFEDSYGGRAPETASGTKRVLLYGGVSESMRASLLLHKNLDRAAMLVNLRYGLGPSDPKPSLFDPAGNQEFMPAAQRSWSQCDAYGRDSSRATADFATVERFLWRNGIGEISGVGQGNSEKSDEALREVIGHLEHLRWNAYIATTGFTLRPWDELPSAYARALSANKALAQPAPVGKVFKDVTVDLVNREHAALVDWEYLPELDELFARMGRETGTYDELLAAGRLKPNQQKDRDIVDDLIV